MLFTTWFFMIIRWHLLTKRATLLWCSVLGPRVSCRIHMSSIVILIVVFLLLPIKHRELWFLLVLTHTMSYSWFLWLLIQLLLWQFHYFVFYLNVFRTLFSLFFPLLLLLLLLLHKLIYLYHISFSHLINFKRLLRLTHVLYSLAFCTWLLLCPKNLLYPWVLERYNVFWRTSHFLQLLTALLSGTLFGAWVLSRFYFFSIFLRVKVIVSLFRLLNGVFGLLQGLFGLL